jgi:deoxyribose-phosphate aldolase
LETSQLDTYKIVAASVLSIAAGADFIKTSTGFLGRGASLEDVQTMRAVAEMESVKKYRVDELKNSSVKVKASGGIRTVADVVKMAEAGAERIGASAGVAIMEEAKGTKTTNTSSSGY